jgi:hypothetical protein
VFRGVADMMIMRKPHRAPGGLWLISKEHERTLDRLEGVANDFYQKLYFDFEKDGQTHECLFYKMRPKGVQPPYEDYLEIVEQGYRDFGLPLDYLNRVVHHSWKRKRVTAYLRRRHRLKGFPKLGRPKVLNAGYTPSQVSGEID